MVDDVYDELRKSYSTCGGKIDVIIESSGGDLDATYNLAMLFRKYGNNSLNFIIPRWAKSAATLLACAGDSIMMTPVAELGPLDPQITEMNPLEGRLEKYSPLHLNATLGLIRKEYTDGNQMFAEGLLKRLQFPLTLGSIEKSIEIAQQYLLRLLITRMLKGNDVITKTISEKLTTGYADHGYCINSDEAKSLGLKVYDLNENQLNIVWDIHKLSKEKNKIETKMKREKMANLIKEIPPELLNSIPSDIKNKIIPTKSPSTGENNEKNK